MDSPLYKNADARAALMVLYDKNLAACGVSTDSIYVDTFAGKTHVLACGDKHKPPLVVLHGIHAGAPLAIRALQGLGKTYRLYAVDTIGQVTRSAENSISMDDDSFGKWLAETMEQLGIQEAPVIGVSYGAFILQKLMTHYPEKITKGVLVVPSGLVNGPFWASIRKLSWPLMLFFMTKKEKYLRRFMSAFYTDVSDQDVAFQRNLLEGVKLDMRRPSLLTRNDVGQLEAPVYVMVADDDSFFPGLKAIAKCKKVFKNFKGYHVLSGSKHIPSAQFYPEIEEKIRKWLAE